jgi:hypothetical protein
MDAKMESDQGTQFGGTSWRMRRSHPSEGKERPIRTWESRRERLSRFEGLKTGLRGVVHTLKMSCAYF